MLVSEKQNKILDFSIKALLFTNIWTFTYTNLIAFLNSNFPVQLNQQFLWIQSEPESYEIPIFLILSALSVLIIFLINKIKFKKINLPINLKIIFLLLLLLLFILNIGPYPMSGEIDPYTLRSNRSIYLILPFIYLVIFGLLIWLSRYLNRYLLFGVILLFLAVLTFDAGFPMAGHDYEYFIGPTYEVAQGKTVYTDILSRYSFLTIELFALLLRFKVLNLFYIPAIIWLLYVIQYFLCFLLLFKVSKSKPFAALGTFSIITVNYFSLSHLPSVIPQVGPLRWLPMILLLFIFSKIKSLESKKLIFSVALASFFMIDVGIAILLAYGYALFILWLKKDINLTNIVKTVLLLLISLISILLVVNILHILFGYKPVDILTPFYSFKKHAVLGLSLIPMATKTYFWFVPLIYFASIIYLFQNRWPNKILSGGRSAPPSPSATDGQEGNVYPSKRSEVGKPLTESDKINNILLLFSANLSLFASVYFVGRSHPHNLFNISLFPLLNLFILLGLNINKKFSKIFFLILFSLFIIIPVFQRKFTLTEMILTKIHLFEQENLLQSQVEEIIKTMYKEEINLLKNNLSNETLILSSDDTYLFNVTGKKNLLDANPIMGIDVEEDIDFALKNTVKNCPQKIAIDCSFVGKCQSYTPFVGVKFDLNLILNRIETACKINYSPTACTNKLCISSSI